MKKMIKDKTVLNIRQHIIIKNFWEYYITDRYEPESDIQEALVFGAELELGDISLSELKPYIITLTELDENSVLMPAPNWRWK